MNLQEEKIKLVKAYEKVLKEIDDYGVRDIAVSSGPLKEMLNRRDNIKLRIEEINKLLNYKN